MTTTLFGAVCALFTQIIMIKKLTLVEYGVFSAGFSLVLIAAQFITLGISSYWLKVFGKEGWEAQRYFSGSFKFSTISTIVIITLLAIWALMGPNDSVASWVLLILSFVLIVQAPYDYVSAKYQLEERFGHYAVWQLLPHILRLAFVLTIVFIFEKASASSIAFTYLAVSVILFLIGVRILHELIRGRFFLKKHGLRSAETTVTPQKPSPLAIAKKAYPFGIVLALSYVFYQCDIVFLKYMQNPAAAGVYNTAFLVIGFVYLFPVIVFTKFLQPLIHWWSYYNTKQLKRTYLSGNVIMVSLGILAMFCLWIASEITVSTLFGEKYYGAVAIIQILAIGVPFRFLSSSCGAVLMTRENISVKATLIITVAVLNILLNILLIPAYAGLGAAISTVASEIVLCVLFFIFATKALNKDNSSRRNNIHKVTVGSSQKKGRIGIVTSSANSLTNFRGPLITEWISSGLDVYALAPDFDDESKSAVLALGAIPIDIHMSRTGRNPIDDLWSIISLVFLFRKLKLDMVFCYYIKPVVYGMLAARIARVRRRYALVAGAGYIYSDSSSKNIRHRMLRSAVNWMCRRGVRSANMVFFQNHDDLELFHKLGIVNNDKAALTGGTGVDLSSYKQVQPYTSPTTFILAARLLLEKGIREFAQAAREVKEKHTNTRFILLGGLDPNPNGLVVEEISAWVDEGVLEWPGEVKDVYSWLKKSSVFVLPSYYREGVPRSTQEAMATGLPVITCDTVGCRETVIDGETGLLVAPRDVASLASAMMHFVENPDDIIRMGDAGRKFAQERFDVQQINKKILQSMGIK